MSVCHPVVIALRKSERDNLFDKCMQNAIHAGTIVLPIYSGGGKSVFSRIDSCDMLFVINDCDIASEIWDEIFYAMGKHICICFLKPLSASVSSEFRKVAGLEGLWFNVGMFSNRVDEIGGIYFNNEKSPFSKRRMGEIGRKVKGI